MPVMPRQGHVDRRAVVKANEQQHVEDMTNQERMQRQHQMMVQQQQMQQQRQRQQNTQPLSYEERKEHRRKDMLTDEEMTEGVEDGSKHGAVFRVFFVGLIASILLFLLFLKVDAEKGFELPEHVKRLSYANQGVGSDGKTKASPISDLPEAEQAKIDSYLEALNVKKPEEKVVPEDQDVELAETAEQRIKRIRRENHEFKETLKNAHTQKMDEHQALTVCGRECSDKYGAMQIQYDLVNQKVDNELWSVLSEDEDTAEANRENPSFVNPHQVKKIAKAKIDKLKEEVTEEGTEAHLDQQLAIKEIIDAEAIMTNTESRTYYLMTGMKPPVSMSKTSARDGGWGQSLLTRTHFHKLILAWLQFLENSKYDTFTILFVFICLFLGPALAKLPQTVAMAQRMAEEWEEAAEVQKRTKMD